MASPQASDKLFCNVKAEMYWADDDYSTSAELSSTWFDMRDYNEFSVLMTAGNLTGAGVKALDIYADSDPAGGGTPTKIKAFAGSAGSVEGDYLVLSVTAEEIRQEAEDAGVDFRYVMPYLTLANAADEAAVCVIRSGARFPQDGLTADVVT
ncbi:MAG TPA: hypothetical protein VMY35_08580 [Phycisphaerae bacterium]|nr:hypothetical protein [Phycisphaerae bacterium]